MSQNGAYLHKIRVKVHKKREKCTGRAEKCAKKEPPVATQAAYAKLPNAGQVILPK